MKKLFLLLLAIAPALAFSQEKYVIVGKLGNINPPAKAYLSYVTGGKLLIDSSAINDGAFRFSGDIGIVTQGKLVLLRNPHSRVMPLRREAIIVYLTNGTTVINTPDSLQNATVTGTKVNEDEQEYEHYARQTGKSSIQRKERDSLFIAAHPNSYVSLQLIKNMGVIMPNYNKLQPLFSSLSAGIRDSRTGADYEGFLNTLKAVNVNELAPDFTQVDSSGNPVKLSSFRGKYVLVDFWASWCHPCREENPNVVKAYNSYKAKNFTVLSVSLDAPSAKSSWLNAVRHDGLTWTNVYDAKKGGFDNEAAKLYGINFIPQNILLDPDGKIIAKNLRGDELQQELASVLDKK